MLSRQTVSMKVSPTQQEDSSIPLFKAEGFFVVVFRFCFFRS